MTLPINSPDNLNQARILGFLGKTPEFRTAYPGQEIAYLSIATNDNNAVEKRNFNTQWHQIHVWDIDKINQLKEFAKKGMKIYIEGEITYHSINDKFIKPNTYKKAIIKCDKKDQMKIYHHKIDPPAIYFETEK